MKFCYISSGNNYAPDKHLIDGLRENGHEIEEIVEKSLGIEKYLRLGHTLLKRKNRCDAVIVGYTLPHFVPLVRLLIWKSLIYNALASQYEANIISRGTDCSLLVVTKWWLVDFLSLHLPSKVLLESAAQIDFVSEFFFIPKKKLVRSWTGVDEKIFFRDKSVEKFTQFTVLFRGRFLPESGIDTIIPAAKLLEHTDIRFLIIGHGFLYKTVNRLMTELVPKNVEIIEEKLLPGELRRKMLATHLSLGQMANHPRLLRTLPFKLYESLALGLPYLTGRNPGIFELLKEDETCFAVTPGDAKALAQKILSLKSNHDLLTRVAEQGHALYTRKLTSKKLAEEVIWQCFKNN